MTTTTPLLANPLSGYYHREIPREDDEITHVGPGTPCGEWFRRFWHPIAYSHELADLPHSIRILGEDLVLFRNGSGNVGLLELHCSHRGTSLEFGLIEKEGLRCCYHGWMFGVDGRILDTPGEPPDSTYKERLCHGAYPVQEYKGMVWAYMGPSEKLPPFPRYDVFELPGYELTLGRKNILPCNWLQVADNLMDPAHLTFLHTRSSGVQFLMDDGRPSPEYGMLAELDWMQTPSGMICLATRRIGDDVWVRVSDRIHSDMHHFSGHPLFPPDYEEGKQEVSHIARFTKWSVPIDNTNTLSLMVIRVPKGDQVAPSGHRSSLTAPAVGGDGGQTGDRLYEEKQRFPGDYEVQVSQRPIAIHALEHLGATDRGVTLLRKTVRDGVRAVQRGEDPPGLTREAGSIISTRAGDIFFRMPPAETPEEDKQLLRETGRRVGERFLNRPTTTAVVFDSRHELNSTCNTREVA